MFVRSLLAAQTVLRQPFSVAQAASCLYSSEASTPSPRMLMIKEIRDRTSAPLLDCKKALDEGGSVEAALELLRAKGLKTVAKEGRVAEDGALAATSVGKRGSLIELRSETDFVARLDDFQQLAQSIASRLIDTSEDVASVDGLLNQTVADGGQTIRESISALMYKTGEKLELKRVYRTPEFNEDSQTTVVVASYVHPGAKHASLVALRATGQGATEPANKPEFETLAKHLAIQIAGFKPKYISRVDLPADATFDGSEESPFLLDQKFYIHDASGPTVQDTLARKSSQLQSQLSVETFKQWSLGVE